MPDISKINALAIGSVAKVDGLAKASILDIDGVTVPADGAPVAAYSVRLLGSAVGISSYTGDCMRVRRASDNVEADVGFDAGELKLTSPISNTSDAQSYTDFADFVDHTGTPTDAFCRYWYDQSGNANDAGQSTAGSQPQIYDATTGLITLNGKPIIQATENVTSFTSTSISQAAPYTIMSVSYNQNDFNRASFYGNGSDIRLIMAKNRAQLQILTEFVRADAAYGDAAIIGTGIVNGTSSFVRALSANASADSTGTLTDTDITDIQPGGVSSGASSMQELILWDGALSSTETAAIETNMDTYFSVS